MIVVWVLILCGWSLLGTLRAAPSSKCGTSVYYPLTRLSPHCLRTNATSTTPVRAALHLPGKVSTSLELSAESPVELQPQPRGSGLRLWSTQVVCYHLVSTDCKVGGRERRVRDTGHDSADETGHSQSGGAVLALTVMTLLVLLPLAAASFLCCHAEEKGSQTTSRRRLSRKERKSLTTSGNISINITDSDNPLGSDHFTTFHKSEDDKPTTSISMAGGRQSTPSVVKEPSVHTSRQLLESSLDFGPRPDSRNASPCHSPQPLESSLDVGPGARPESRRDGQQPGTSSSSMLSLGPRVPPDGSSLGNLSNIEKNQSPVSSTHHLPPGMPPPPSIPPPPSHLRQNSTPVSFTPHQPTTSPLPKARPLTIIGQPTPEDSAQSALPPALPPKPEASPPLSPVSLSESEALCPVRPGRVHPYRVVHQPSGSLSSLTHLPHSSDGTVCAYCGAKLTAGVDAVVDTNTEELSDELCQECQASDHNYQELELVEEDTLTSPPAIPSQTDSSKPADPLYERIGSIRRQHMVSAIRTTSHAADGRSEVTPTTFNPKVPPRLPLISRIPSPKVKARETCPLPQRQYPTCPLLSEGAPLPQRPSLDLQLEECSDNHNYESLPSTFDLPSPEHTVYASIPSPDEEDPATPPYIPENSQRAQMLKIDSEGYAEVVNTEDEAEPYTPEPDAGYSPLHSLHSPASQPMASDYEVPVRCALLQQPPVTSPSFLLPSPPHSQTSPSHRHPSPIPVPSPTIPPTNTTPLPISPSAQLKPTSPTTPALTRQAAIAENLRPLHSTRSLQVLPDAERESMDDRRESTGSVASYHLTFRLSTASSGLGDSMTESLRAIAEEEAGRADGGLKRAEGATRSEHDDTSPAVLKRKIYEVKNRSRTKSYPAKSSNTDHTVNRQKAKTMHVHIQFNEDSQAV